MDKQIRTLSSCIRTQGRALLRTKEFALWRADNLKKKILGSNNNGLPYV